MPAPDAEYTRWIGRAETVHDMLAPAQSVAAAAMLDRDARSFDAGAPLPLLWHWFHFHNPAPQAQLAADGHPPRGGFLPPVPQARRMFAGARLTFHRPLLLAQPARREGEVRDVTMKHGRSGALAFVRVGYRYLQGDALCLEEEQDLVYRDPSPAATPAEPVAPPDPSPDARVDDAPAHDAQVRTMHADSRLLFRFSALTFNAHRIHYDLAYARDVEGYPGLVVHGQLIAMQLLALASDATAGVRDVQAFAFRSERPVFGDTPVRLLAWQDGDTVHLEARGPDGRVAQGATATLR